MREGTIVEWLRAVGDTVDEDEPLVEVEAEKVTATVGAPGPGILARIIVEPGQTVAVGTLLAVIAEPEEKRPDVVEEEL